MDYNFFKLSFMLYLQKKYWSTFKLAPQGIFVLPPVFRRQKIAYSLAFPVVKRDENDKISRPIGVILVDKNGKEQLFDLNNYEFTSYSQDFTEKYNYLMKKQEDVKVALEFLLYSLKNKKLFEKDTTIFTPYYSKLKELFDDNFWKYYIDLQTNEIVLISQKTLDIRKHIAIENIDELNISNNTDKSNKLKKDFTDFIKKEILPQFKELNSLEKLFFFDALYKEIVAKNFKLESPQHLNQAKFIATKIYAKIVCQDKKFNNQINFVTKILIMILNCLLIKTIKPQEKEELDDEIFEYSRVFNKEIFLIKEQDVRNEIIAYYNDIEKAIKNSNSSLFSAYQYIFK